VNRTMEIDSAKRRVIGMASAGCGLLVALLLLGSVLLNCSPRQESPARKPPRDAIHGKRAGRRPRPDRGHVNASDSARTKRRRSRSARGGLTRNTHDPSSIVLSADGDYLELKPELKIDPHTLFARYPQAFGLGVEDRMVLYDSEHISFGHTPDPMTTYRFQEYHEDRLVEAAVVLVHAENGVAVSLNGDFARGIDAPSRPGISEASALAAAMEAVGGEVYAWEVDSLRSNPDIDSMCTVYPRGVLAFVSTSDIETQVPGRYMLVWKFLIRPYVPFDPREVWVDATSGKVVLNRSTIIIN
jgi:hypothetical protein